jgi:KUP system potassium uptake protein
MSLRDSQTGIQITSPGSHAPQIRDAGDLAKLSLGALGVVYGDIGTSPLYAIKECFAADHGVAPSPENVLGILSLAFWSLVLVVVVKYIVFVLRADHHGEGGILALLALVTEHRSHPKPGEPGRKRHVSLILLGLVGASLLLADGMITPAVSVLGALEGLQVATPGVKPLIVPAAVGILLALFLFQRRGTGGIAAVFGPVTLLWFAAIALLGARSVLATPEVLAALGPWHAARFFARNGAHGFLILGAVVLCITGAEALYADLGHFGRRPIRLAWFVAVFPALVASYFGQGALLLRSGAAIQNPFFELAPGPLLYPLVAIATAAAIIASQAMISGAFSLAQQAVQLGYLPRLTIVHTSGEARGQIYVPEINGFLLVACLTLVVAFRTTTALAAAYGIAVIGTMVCTSLLMYQVARRRWRWSELAAAVLVGLFLAVDLPFLAANLVKFAHGGWVPVLFGFLMLVVMTTWRAGRKALHAQAQGAALPLDHFIAELERNPPHRVAGTAVFLTSEMGVAPGVLLHHFKHNKVLHRQVVLLTIVTEGMPEVPRKDRVAVREMGQGFWEAIAHYGFMETPNVPRILSKCGAFGLQVDPAQSSYFLGRETLLPTGRGRIARWRKRLFIVLARNARPANAFFRIPANRVVELGAQVEL